MILGSDKKKSNQADASRRYTILKRLTRQYKGIIQEYQYILNEMSQCDLSNMYKNQSKIIKQTEIIMRQWQQSRQHTQLLQKMLCIFYEKVRTVPYTRLFLHKLYACCEYVSGKIGFQLSYCRRLYRIQVENCQTDQLYTHFVQEQQSISSRSAAYIVKDKNGRRLPLKEVIASTQSFNNLYWHQILLIVKSAIQRQSNQQSNKQKQAYLSKLHLQVAPNLSCLGCSEFFFQNRSIVNYQRQSNLVIMDGIKAYNKETLKTKINQLLSEKGGVILFDCVKQYLDICPKGQKLTQQQKISFKDEIQKIVKSLDASPSSFNKVVVSFVPVKYDPYYYFGQQKRDEAGCEYIDRKFIPGQYVLRIKVNSKQDNSDRYSWRFNTINHQCKAPLKGQQLTQAQPVKIQIVPTQYKYASALVVKHCFHQAILKGLQKYNVNGELLIRFQQYKLKGVANVALFYHNTKHQDLCNIVAYNPQFQYQGKYLMVIPITDFLKLAERSSNNIMSKNDFDNLGLWLKKQFPNQKLKMWEYENQQGDSEFYIETQSKASTLFIYIVMSNFKEKSLFKVNKHLQKMSLRQLQSTLKLHYSSE